jgi:uncharacterized protein HemY
MTKVKTLNLMRARRELARANRVLKELLAEEQRNPHHPTIAARIARAKHDAQAALSIAVQIRDEEQGDSP